MLEQNNILRNIASLANQLWVGFMFFKLRLIIFDKDELSEFVIIQENADDKALKRIKGFGKTVSHLIYRQWQSIKDTCDSAA